MTSKPKSSSKPTAAIGDFIARLNPEADGTATVFRKGASTASDQRISQCLTLDGAERLAALCNAARDLGQDWPAIAISTPFKNGTPKEWVARKIVDAITRALDGRTDGGAAS